MDITEARALAEQALAERALAEQALAEPLPGERPTLLPDDQVTDLGWAWVFPRTTGDPSTTPPPGCGPIVVVKATAHTWPLNPAHPYDRQLDFYAARHSTNTR